MAASVILFRDGAMEHLVIKMDGHVKSRSRYLFLFLESASKLIDDTLSFTVR